MKFNMKVSSPVPTVRILPDICVLISHTLSRLIKLEFLEGFEIVILDCLLYIVEVLCDGRLKAGFYNEIDELKKLEKNKKVNIL
jgi:predicted PilT family ATPase